MDHNTKERCSHKSYKKKMKSVKSEIFQVEEKKTENLNLKNPNLLSLFKV